VIIFVRGKLLKNFDRADGRADLGFYGIFKI
ncbi:unnamed protein product, partial [marine sediment metagenome]